MSKNFSDRLRDAIVAGLEAKNLSRYRLSKMVGVGQSMLSGFILGRHWVGERTLNKLARACDLHVETRAKGETKRN